MCVLHHISSETCHQRSILTVIFTADSAKNLQTWRHLCIERRLKLSCELVCAEHIKQAVGIYDEGAEGHLLPLRILGAVEAGGRGCGDLHHPKSVQVHEGEHHEFQQHQGA